MIQTLKNWWRGRYWQVEYADAFAHETYLLPERYYSSGAAERKVQRMQHKLLK